MSRIRFESKIPSCHVTKDLVQALENYLVSRLSALAASDAERERLREGLSIEITDAFGTEKLASINEYVTPRFSDDTSQVTVELERPTRSSFPYFDIDIQLNRQMTHAKVRIVYEGENAREFVAGVSQGITECIKTQATGNWFFHPPATVEGALWVIAPVSPWVAAGAYKVSVALGSIALIATLLLLVYTFVLKRLRPYITFESNAAERLERRWSWFIGGLLSFLVFSSLLTWFRDVLFSAISGAR